MQSQLMRMLASCSQRHTPTLCVVRRVLEVHYYCIIRGHASICLYSCHLAAHRCLRHPPPLRWWTGALMHVHDGPHPLCPLIRALVHALLLVGGLSDSASACTPSLARTHFTARPCVTYSTSCQAVQLTATHPWVHTSAAWYCVMLNSLVHVLMYTYYLVAAALGKDEQKKRKCVRGKGVQGVAGSKPADGPCSSDCQR